MGVETPFVDNLSQRLATVDVKHPEAVMEAMAVSMAELVRGLKAPQVFNDVYEEISLEPEEGLVTGILHVDLGGRWSPAHQSLVYFILKQGFVYTRETGTYRYMLEL